MGFSAIPGSGVGYVGERGVKNKTPPNLKELFYEFKS